MDNLTNRCCVCLDQPRPNVDVSLRLFDGLYTWAADYLVFEVEGWSIIADAWSRVLREVFLFIFSFGYLWYVLRRRPETQSRFQLTGVGAPKLRRKDVQRYLQDAIWILIISYCDVIVSNVTGVLTSRLSTDEASANRILMTSSDWPYVFSSAFGAVITTLGARYIGEKDGARFQRLGVSLGLIALAIGLASGAVALFFSDSVFRFFTQDLHTLALLEERTVVLVFIVSFVVGLVTSVPAGMVVAAQQFKFMALSYASGLVLVYIPIVVYAVEVDTASLSWLYGASTAYCLWKFIAVCYCALVLVPRGLEAQRGHSNEPFTNRAEKQPTPVPLGAQSCDRWLFGILYPDE